MAFVESNMLPIGTQAPDFTLEDAVSQETISLQEISSGRPTVVMFLSNHCPFVKHINAGIASVARDYQGRGVAFVAIASNDISRYPQDAPPQMKALAEREGFPFPYVYDPSQEVARAYDAACTPDFYVFDRTRRLAYRGRLDEARPGNGKPVTGQDLRAALDCVLADKNVPEPHWPSGGCSIKWKD